MINTPCISVLVPICNVEQYLDQCLSSIQKQTLSNIEVICINDGSKDSSKAIIEKYTQKDSRFILIDKSNSGYGDSMNRGLEKARGEYIAIVESDDYVALNMLESLYKLTDNGSVDIVKGNFWDCYEDESTGRLKCCINHERTIPNVENEAFDVYDMPQILWGHPSIWSAIYRRDYLRSNNIWFMCEPGGGWVDNPFFFETLLLAKRIKWTNTPYYYYRKTNPNSSSNHQPDLTLPLRRMIDNLNVVEKYNVHDKELLKMVYSRALMYLYGVLEDRNHLAQIDDIRKHAVALFSRIDESVIDEFFNEKDRFLFYTYRSALVLQPQERIRILIYNWVQFDNPFGFGGGVNIYCRNLVETILALRPDIEVYFLSSGFAYDASTTECYIRSTNNCFSEKCYSFEIVNSPVPAAQDRILNCPEIAFSQPELKRIFLKFLSKYGSFNVIHFNNIEGLSLDCLEIRNHVSSKLIFSIHNYIPFCVHGFYFNREKKCVCTPNHTDLDCEKCICVANKDSKTEWDLYQRATNGTQGICIEKNIWLSKMGFVGLDGFPKKEMLLLFCKKAVAILNENMDLNLAVSDCVKRIAIENGLRKDCTVTSYIGTKVAQFTEPMHIQESSKKGMTIVFLGSNYYFEEKGYPFLMDTLSGMEKIYASQIDLVLTTTNGSETQMMSMLSHFHSVKIIHGYNHSDLRTILRNVDLGIVPVLWEDNLPQIAIEMVANGVPVLSSDLGGASELCKSDLFKFIGGSSDDLRKHIIFFLEHREKLNEYWIHSSELVTMSAHWMELEKLYEIPPMVVPQLTHDDYLKLVKELTVLKEIASHNIDTNGRTDHSRKRHLFEFNKYFKKTILYWREFGLIETIKKISQKVAAH